MSQAKERGAYASNVIFATSDAQSTQHYLGSNPNNRHGRSGDNLNIFEQSLGGRRSSHMRNLSLSKSQDLKKNFLSCKNPKGRRMQETHKHFNFP